MSTSFNPARAAEAKSEPESRPFLYAEVATEVGVATKTGSSPTGKSIPGSNEMLAQRETASREMGRLEGEAQERAAGEAHLAQVREAAGAAVADFARDRARYYQQVEAEVVQLALAIARKILHRETQLDPLLLAGLVRINLEKIESATKVVVRVHPRQVSEWRGYFAQHMESQSVPEVVEDSGVKADHCILQTALGTTELGVEIQLKEIELGLFDLLAKRPPGV